MSNIVIAGNLTGDPELKYTAGGRAVANATVAVTARVKDGDAWKDGDTAFYRIAVWGAPAEHFAASAFKGARVVVSGTLTPREYEVEGGVKRISLDVTADEVGMSVKFKPIGGAAQSSPYNDSYGNSDPWAQNNGEAPF